ncbi:BMP family ABC transporter substrate-binding protein [Mangrovibrevibacter kandeliae]|uniref:BMP family ABC transporter substrate-binding protein n=1 Tax=Mangrovibrevibacter kandeliae TaxID=2968473 RepID=UPI0021199423|nr:MULTISPECIES: BMP family ABC transporter substrate-binding protein [unclassified Aurantimonas]MCQ8783210.1 BMP family ABC transporter substrate-binding protein [Aurantimonas sp. CSK15Z-1]MCW4115542.1 BMP family ABC transporter substrate-binding protein [Aurantimonas sp. MSK8Z-1]
MFEITRRRLLTTAGSLATVSAFGLPARAQGKDKVKAAFVYVGPVGDYGYSFAHDQGRKFLEEKLGDKVETSFVENVAEGPDAERVIRQLAQGGNDVVFATSFGFMNPTLKVAKQFPDVKFEHATGYMTAPNMAAYNSRFYQGRAVLGTIAGMMSKSGKGGYVASFPIPEVVMGIDAFTLAARKVNPNFTTQVVWVSSWYDPAKEADAAKALLDQGVDVITQHTDSPAPLQAAEQRGAIAFGQAWDMSSFAPNAHMTAIVDHWGPYYVQEVQKLLDGTWESHDVWLGMQEDVLEMAPFNPKMPDDVKAAAQKIVDETKAGTYEIFTGPIKDQKGELKAKDGERIPDADLLKLDWYVEGVNA